MFFRPRSPDLSRAQFDAARLGFLGLLRRKRMSPQFVERHAEDLLAQAYFEYTRRLSEGIEIFDPPAWIVKCAWNRTKSQLESRDWRPEEVSYDVISEQADTDAATPEEVFLAEDRRRKIREAVDELPERHRRLLALSYFEGESVREAARMLRWTPSKAQRAHESAQKKIHAILGVESTDEIQIEFGLLAYLAVASERGARHAVPAGAETLLDRAHDGAHGMVGGADRMAHAAREMVHRGAAPSSLPGRLATEAHARAASGRGPVRRIGDLARRVLPGGPGEAGTFLAGEGGTRMAEVCKGLAVCVVGGGALTGAIIGGGGHHHTPPQPQAIGRSVAVKVDRAPRRAAQSSPATEASFDTASTTSTAAAVSSAPRPHRRNRSGGARTGDAPEPREVKTASPVADRAEASSTETPEGQVEEQFGDFDSTESSSAAATSTTDSRSTSSAPSTSTSSAASGGTTSTHSSSGGEEAAAAKEFHGLLE